MNIRALTKGLRRLGKRLHSERGFTLVELLVTVTIIGILAAVVTVGVSGVASSSQTKANQALFSAHQTLIDAWLAANPLKDPDTGVPYTATVIAATEAGKWYTANGQAPATDVALNSLSGYSTGSTYRAVDSTSTSGDIASTQFKKFFRLGNAAATTLCLVTTTASNNVFVCKN